MKSFFTLFTIFISLSATCQLDKKTWLVGGSGKYYSYTSENNSSGFNRTAKYTQIDISPSIGYFVLENLAFGLRPTFSSIKGKATTPGGGQTNVQRYLIGPFGRYYLLNNEKSYNIVTDFCFQAGIFDAADQNGNLSAFSALIGPVVYFNSSVGMELLLGYSYSKEDIEQVAKDTRKGFQLSVGFQIHLKK